MNPFMKPMKPTGTKKRRKKPFWRGLFKHINMINPPREVDERMIVKKPEREEIDIDLPVDVGTGTPPKQRELFISIRDFVSENMNRSGRVTNEMVAEIKNIQKKFSEAKREGLVDKQIKKSIDAMESLIYKATGSSEIPKAGEKWNPQKPADLKPLPTVPEKRSNKRLTKKGIWSLEKNIQYPGTRNERIDITIYRRGRNIVDIMNIRPGHVLSTPVGTYRYLGRKKFGYSGWKPEKGPIIDRDLLPGKIGGVKERIVRNTIIPYLRNMNITDEISNSIVQGYLRGDESEIMRALQRSNMTNDEIEGLLDKISFEPEEGSDSRLVKPRKVKPKVAQSHKWYGFPSSAYDKKKKAIRVTTVGEF